MLTCTHTLLPIIDDLLEWAACNMASILKDREDNIPTQTSIEDYVHGCKITPIDAYTTDIEQLWKKVYKEGKLKGFCPVLLDADSCFYDSLDEAAV